MRWTPESVAGFAEHAGWRDDDLVTAVAVALAASGGEDAARWTADPGPTVDTRGLWQLDVVAHPELAGLDLYHPQVNATAAWGLWVSEDGTWDWHLAFQSGAWRWHVPEARAAVANLASTSPLPTTWVRDRLPGPVGAAVRVLDEVAQRAASLVRASHIATH